MTDILVPISLFAMIFGIVYMRSRERMAMIDKGINPHVNDGRPRPFVNLKWGLLLIGSGTGLLVSFLLNILIYGEMGNTADNLEHGTLNPVFLSFALIAIGGGLGLFFSYRIEKKEWLDKVKKEQI
jgi:hypothetical protein